MENSKVIWIDVETTGLSAKKDQIIELAALYEDGIDENKSKFHIFCKPPQKTDNWDFISDLTGITWEFLEENGVDEKTMYQKFKQWINQRVDSFNSFDKAIFAAYNAGFDNRFMRALFEKNSDKYFGSYFESANLDILATVAMARKNGILPQLKNNKQDTVANHLGIQFKAHSAIEDIKAGRQVQLILEKKMKR